MNITDIHIGKWYRVAGMQPEYENIRVHEIRLRRKGNGTRYDILCEKMHKGEMIVMRVTENCFIREVEGPESRRAINFDRAALTMRHAKWPLSMDQME